MNDLAGARVLVTGGAGLVGSSIVNELVPRLMQGTDAVSHQSAIRMPQCEEDRR